VKRMNHRDTEKKAESQIPMKRSGSQEKYAMSILFFLISWLP